LLALLGAHHIFHVSRVRVKVKFNPLNAKLNPICHLLALLGAHHILHVSRIRVKVNFNPLNAKLNPICHLLALLGSHRILHVSRIRPKTRVKSHLSFACIIRSSPVSLPPGRTRYPLYRRQDGSQGRSGQVLKPRPPHLDSISGPSSP